jgi:hypothetical protein
MKQIKGYHEMTYSMGTPVGETGAKLMGCMVIDYPEGL